MSGPSSKLTEYMLNNYARAVSLELGEWLAHNPPPSICEEKLDGFRVFAFKSGSNILLATRHGRIYSESTHPLLFKTIKPLLEMQSPSRAVLDGEYIAPDRMSIFDVLRIDDREVTGLPLLERKSILSQVLTGESEPFLVKYFLAKSTEEIQAQMKRVVERGGEGLVVKNPSSTYGQRNSWLKLKRFDTIDCFVTGYDTTKEMERTGIPHSWFIGLCEPGGSILEIGKVGTYLKEIDPLRIKLGTVVEVQYQQVTSDRKLRQPFIIRIREDKTKEECSSSQLGGAAKKNYDAI